MGSSIRTELNIIFFNVNFVFIFIDSAAALFGISYDADFGSVLSAAPLLTPDAANPPVQLSIKQLIYPMLAHPNFLLHLQDLLEPFDCNPPVNYPE